MPLARWRRAASARSALTALAALIVIAALTACARWAPSPRYGSLTVEDRKLHLEHNVELLEVANGMKVALVRDDRTNLVTVDMRYTVGFAEDPPDRAGMAHLVEHLLFELRAAPGGPTLNDELSELALANNAFTRADETHYTATGPVANLDAMLALEARRLRFRCDQLEPATFARERDVVLAEVAQRADPFDPTRRSLYQAIYGVDHPYARAAAPSQVAAITRDEACAFIATHYAPERAVLVVTGPFETQRTLATISTAFGPIPRGHGARAPMPPHTLRNHTSTHVGAVDHPTVVVAFAHPPWGAKGGQIASIVEGQLSSALDEAIEDVDWIRSGTVTRMGDNRAPVTLVTLELDDVARASEAAKLVFRAAASLVTNAESTRTIRLRRGAHELEVVAAWDQLGDRGAWLASYLQYTTHRWFMLRELAELHELERRDLFERALALTPDRAHVAIIHPDPRAGRAGALTLPALQSHDLQPWRRPVDPAEARRPLSAAPVRLSERAQAFELPNGLRVVLAADHRSPIVDARLVFPGGTAHEPRDRPGLAYAAAYLLDHDTDAEYDQADLARILWAGELGTQSDIDVDETTTTFATRGLSYFGDWHVWWLSWLLDQGVYSPSRLERLRARVRAQAERAKARGKDRAASDRGETAEDTRRFLERLFGKGHPYASPPFRRDALLAIGERDLERWRRDHYRARGATLILSGGFDPVRMRRIVTELFGPWSGGATAALPVPPQPAPMPGASWLAVRDAQLTQARLTIAFQSGSDPLRDEAARTVLARIVEDRLRLVREGMGASYGIDAAYLLGASGGALVIHGKVDTARAGEILARLLAELATVRAAGPGFDVDFVRARRRALATALAYTGGASATARVVQSLAQRGLDLDHAAGIASQIARLTPAHVAAVAAADLAAARMVVQVAGPPAVVDAAFARAGAKPE